jgi:hypothetical protein
VTRPSTQRTSSQRICPKSFAQTSPARERSVPTPIAILLTPGRLWSSNANHFIKKDVGWFNEYHFMRMPNITDGVKKLLGNAKGTTSKTA